MCIRDIPVYVISNNGIAYVERAMERNGDTSYPDVPVSRQLSEALALLR